MAVACQAGMIPAQTAASSFPVPVENSRIVTAADNNDYEAPWLALKYMSELYNLQNYGFRYPGYVQIRRSKLFDSPL